MTRLHPLASQPALSPQSDAVRLSALPPALRLALRRPPPGADQPINRAHGNVLRLGPDEWLLIDPAGAAPDLLPPHAVDVSHRTAGIELAGPYARETLNAFVALDLADAAFPVGMCTRTLLGKAEIILWRTGADTYRVEVARSFAAYAWACLEEGRREFL
jgi:heterotetrameric sarcosine oxidase gamma subunit